MCVVAELFSRSHMLIDPFATFCPVQRCNEGGFCHPHVRRICLHGGLMPSQHGWRVPHCTSGRWVQRAAFLLGLLKTSRWLDTGSAIQQSNCYRACRLDPLCGNVAFRASVCAVSALTRSALKHTLCNKNLLCSCSTSVPVPVTLTHSLNLVRPLNFRTRLWSDAKFVLSPPSRHQCH